jgi:hypothetical protein
MNLKFLLFNFIQKLKIIYLYGVCFILIILSIKSFYNLIENKEINANKISTLILFFRKFLLQ